MITQILVPEKLEVVLMAVDGFSLVVCMLFRKQKKARQAKEMKLSRKTWGYLLMFSSVSALFLSYTLGQFPSVLDWEVAVIISAFLFLAGMRGVQND